jgi:hypothetical protein
VGVFRGKKEQSNEFIENTYVKGINRDFGYDF